MVNTNNEKVPYPVPPLGMCLAVNAIMDKYEVKIYDGINHDVKRLQNIIKEFNPDYIGVSVRNIDNYLMTGTKIYTDDILKDFIKPIKSVSNAPLILGGSGFSIYPKEVLEFFDADYGIVGEAEDAFPKLLDYLDKNLDPSNLPRVISKTKKDNIVFPEKDFDLKNMKFADFDKKLDFSFYSENGAYSIQTKRGCYHKCIYCAYPNIEGKTYRVRNPKDIADEIEEAYNRLGPITFEFVDSTFNDPPGHAEAICEELIKRRLKDIRIRTMGINPGNISKRLIELMLEAGFKQMDCTPDSASPKMLVNLKKNFTLDQLIDAASIIKEYDMPTVWFMILGGPGEDESTIKETFDFIDDCVYKYDMVHITTGLYVYPNTDLYDIALKEGLLVTDNDKIVSTHYITKNLGLEKLLKILDEYMETRPNCLTAQKTTPPKTMIKAAMDIRKLNNITEPMFRTMLKLRYQIFDNKALFS
jgi:radical SAM superfamily enzyme YgiQ (UPF0313 family)